MKRTRRPLAFTLVEVLAALAFMGILIPVIVEALMVSNRAAVVSERSSQAAQLGENRLGELLLADAWSSADASGDFGTERPGYHWTLAKSDWESGAMTELKLTVLFSVQGREHQVALSTLANSSLSQTSPQ